MRWLCGFLLPLYILQNSILGYTLGTSDPLVIGIHPQSGPLSGGTNVVLLGGRFEEQEIYAARLAILNAEVSLVKLKCSVSITEDIFATFLNHSALQFSVPVLASLYNSTAFKSFEVQLLHDGSPASGFFSFYLYDRYEVREVVPLRLPSLRSRVLTLRGNFSQPWDVPRVLLRSPHLLDRVLDAEYSIQEDNQPSLSVTIDHYFLPADVVSTEVEVHLALNGVDYFFTNHTINVTTDTPLLEVCLLRILGYHERLIPEGLLNARQKLAKQVNFRSSEMVEGPEQLSPTMQNFIDGDCNAVLTSPASAKLVMSYGSPLSSNINYIFGGTTNAPPIPNVNTCDLDTYESQYLTGIVAGRMTQTNIIGFITIPHFRTVRELNAFILGARSVNPAVKVIMFPQYISDGQLHDPDRLLYIGHILIAMGADIVCHFSDFVGVSDLFHRRGLHSIGTFTDLSLVLGDRVLVSGLALYDVCELQYIEQMLSDSYQPFQRTIGGIKEGLVDITSTSVRVPTHVKSEVQSMRNAIVDGLNIFCGEIRDNEGRVVLEEGRCLTHDEIHEYELFFGDTVIVLVNGSWVQDPASIVYFEGIQNRRAETLPRCGPGKFSRLDDDFHFVSCETCPPGYFSGDADVLECEPCPPGMFATMGVCERCPFGSYSPTPAASLCNRCPPGHYQDQEGEMTCLPCQPGLYTPYSGTISCLACPLTEYNPSPGAEACLRCPQHSASLSVAATNLDQCLCMSGHQETGIVDQSEDTTSIIGRGRHHFDTTVITNITTEDSNLAMVGNGYFSVAGDGRPPCEPCPEVEITLTSQSFRRGELTNQTCDRLRVCAEIEELRYMTVQFAVRIKQWDWELALDLSVCEHVTAFLELPVTGEINGAQLQFELVESNRTSRVLEARVEGLEAFDIYPLDVFVNGTRCEKSPTLVEYVKFTCGANEEVVLGPDGYYLCIPSSAGEGARETIYIIAIGGVAFALIGIAVFVERYTSLWVKKQRDMTLFDEKFRCVREILEQMSFSTSSIRPPSSRSLSMRLEPLLESEHLVVFVVTELMDSTVLANEIPKDYLEMQRIHDELLRSLLETYHGREIEKRAQSFEMVIPDMVSATKFALTLQKRLMDVPWSKGIVNHTSCRTERLPDGRLLFRGPRVQVGIHCVEVGRWRSSMLLRINHQSSMPVGGEELALALARKLSSSAAGGQILLSEASFRQLKKQVNTTWFPLVESLGVFEFPDEKLSANSDSKTMSVFQLHEPLGTWMGMRDFGPSPRNLPKIKPGLGLNIVRLSPESSIRTRNLSVVVMKLCRPKDNTPYDSKSAQKSLMPSDVWKEAYKLVCSLAQVFSGYVNWHDYVKEDFVILFESPQQAIRFALAAQVALLFHTWNGKDISSISGTKVEKMGQVIFKGPRFAIAVHKCSTIRSQKALVANGTCDQDQIQQRQRSNNHFSLKSVLISAAPKWSFLWGSTMTETENNIVHTKSLPEEGSMANRSTYSGASSSMFPKDTSTTHSSDHGSLQVRIGSSMTHQTDLLDGIQRRPKSESVKHSPHHSIQPDQNIVVSPESQPKGRPSKIKSQRPSNEVDQDVFYGEGIDVCFELVGVAYGGQTIVSEAVWKAIHSRLPSHTNVLYLGNHVLRAEGSASMPQAVMELTSQRLSLREFPPLKAHVTLEPGFQSSPRPEAGVAVMFVNVAQVPEVHPQVLKDSIAMYCKCLRQVLREFNGTECKEPDPGKFTLAFHDLHSAIMFACTLQRRLLTLDWPQELLAAPRCQEGRSSDGTRVLYRGLSISAGCAYGHSCFCKALKATGRPDYFGSLPNLAARVLGQAHPTQVLIEGALAVQNNRIRSVRPDTLTRPTPSDVYMKTKIRDEAVRVVCKGCGYVALKGVTGSTWVNSVSFEDLSDREYLPPKSFVANPETPRNKFTRAKSMSLQRLNSIPTPRFPRGSHGSMFSPGKSFLFSKISSLHQSSSNLDQ